MTAKEYKAHCEEVYRRLDEQMDAIGDKRHPEWRRLRKQKIAQQARLRNKFSKEQTEHQLAVIDSVTETLVSEVVKLLGPAKKGKLLACLKSKKLYVPGKTK